MRSIVPSCTVSRAQRHISQNVPTTRVSHRQRRADTEVSQKLITTPRRAAFSTTIKLAIDPSTSEIAGKPGPSRSRARRGHGPAVPRQTASAAYGRNVADKVRQHRRHDGQHRRRVQVQVQPTARPSRALAVPAGRRNDNKKPGEHQYKRPVDLGVDARTLHPPGQQQQRADRRPPPWRAAGRRRTATTSAVASSDRTRGLPMDAQLAVLAPAMRHRVDLCDVASAKQSDVSNIASARPAPEQRNLDRVS